MPLPRHLALRKPLSRALSVPAQTDPRDPLRSLSSAIIATALYALDPQPFPRPAMRRELAVRRHANSTRRWPRAQADAPARGAGLRTRNTP
jgi:hypothetical protein